MAYVVTEQWLAREGFEDHVVEALIALTPLTLSEPGCMSFQASVDRGNVRRFFLYGQYVDEDAFNFHLTTAHFEQFMKEKAFPALEDSTSATYITLDTDTGERGDVGPRAQLMGGP